MVDPVTCPNTVCGEEKKAIHIMFTHSDMNQSKHAKTKLEWYIEDELHICYSAYQTKCQNMWVDLSYFKTLKVMFQKLAKCP